MLLAIDMKFVFDCEKHACAVQVAIVNDELKCVYKSCIKNYNNTCHVHLGVASLGDNKLCNAINLLQVQEDVKKYLKDCMCVVGSYGVYAILKALKVESFPFRVHDISQLSPFKNEGPVALEYFAKKYLGVNLQFNNNDPEGRAICVMKLFKNFISQHSPA